MLNQRKSWSQSEDQLLAQIYEKARQQLESHLLNWNSIADQFNSQKMGQMRTGKQCRERWFNQLDPKIRKSNQWSQQEKSYVLELHNTYGNKWSVISKFLNGRTDNSVKNFINSTLRKGLRLLNLYLSKNKKFTDFQFKNLKQYKMDLLAKILLFSGDLQNYHSQDYSISSNNEQSDEKETLKTVYNLAKSIKTQLLFLEEDYLREKISFSSKKSYEPVQKFQLIIKNIQKLNTLCKKRKQKRNVGKSTDSKIHLDDDYSMQNDEISEQNYDSLIVKSTRQILWERRSKLISKPISLINDEITSNSAKPNPKKPKPSPLSSEDSNPPRGIPSHLLLLQKQQQQNHQNQNLTLINNHVNQNGNKRDSQFIIEKINNQCQNIIDDNFCEIAENTAMERLSDEEDGVCRQEQGWGKGWKSWSATKTKKVIFNDSVRSKLEIIDQPNIWVQASASPYQIPMPISAYLASEDDYFLDCMMDENLPLYPVEIQCAQKPNKFSSEYFGFNLPNILCEMGEDEYGI